jgi:hypothetical protein
LLDDATFAACTSPETIAGPLAQGPHRFRVKALSRMRESSASSYAWIVDSSPPPPTTTIDRPLPNGDGFADGSAATAGGWNRLQVSGSVGGLAPGVWKRIAVRLTNPNDIDMSVTALIVSASAHSVPSGCDSAGNLELRQSSASAAASLEVPANGSVTLPAQGVSAPRIRLKNLSSVNQDACKGTRFGLSYAGTANG